jgi:hypothetical protein
VAGPEIESDLVVGQLVGPFDKSAATNYALIDRSQEVVDLIGEKFSRVGAFRTVPGELEN